MATKQRTAKPWWPQAKKLCRLNQNDIEMAKRLGFKPEGLLKARPSAKERWKLPVKDWIREMYLKKFGEVLGEAKVPVSTPPAAIVSEEEDEVPF